MDANARGGVARWWVWARWIAAALVGLYLGALPWLTYRFAAHNPI